MGFMNKLNKIKFPKLKDLVNSGSGIKEDMQKSELNTIDVVYHSSTFKRSIKVIGTISRNTHIPIVQIKVPEKLKFLLLDECIIFDSTTKRDYVNVVENFPYTIMVNGEINDLLKEQYHKDFINDELGVRNKELFKKTGMGYAIPVLLNKREYELIRIELDVNLPIVTDDDYFTLSSSTLQELGDKLFLQSVNNDNSDGLKISLLIGFLIGAPVWIGLAIYLLS